MSKLCPEDITGVTMERDVYRELADYKLSLLVAEQRLEMMTRMCIRYTEMRANICRQLEPLGYVLTIDDIVKEKSAQ